MNVLKKNIINFEEACFGIDLGDLFVKIVELESNGSQDFVRAYSIAAIPEGSIEDGRIIDKQKVTQAIKTAISVAEPKKINTKKVICSLPESKVFLRVLSIPKMEKAEIGEAIKWEIEASIPLSVDQVYYDWQLIGEVEGKQNILTVAISREIVDDILEVLEGAGLEVYGLEAESVVATRSLINNSDEKGKVSLVVDLGSKRTNFIVTEGNIPFFTSSIPFSSDGVTDAIAKTLGVGNEEAQKLKISQGVGSCDNDDSVFNSMRSYLEGLSVEIEKTIDFYQNINSQSGKVEEIIICGGANLKGLVPYLAKRLGQKIYIGDPWTNLNFGGRLPIISKEKALQFTNAIGLAMRKKDYENRN
ncbi:MAG: type IV pilus assembly protein PilM [Candidatus Moranbacteria bacterium]|nr:type IV pilus assembly protein PilM [Candidatus Moranbacteria bacterium]